MNKKYFVLCGTFRMGRENQPFRIRVDAFNENLAKEGLYSKLSKHRCKRHLIRIHKIEEEK